MYSYFRNGFDKKRWLHFGLVLLISIAIGLAISLVNYSKYPNLHPLKVTSNYFLGMSIVNIIYALFVLMVKWGFGQNIIKYHQNKKNDRLVEKIRNEKMKPSTPEQRVVIKELEKQLEKTKHQGRQEDTLTKNNAIYYLILLIGFITLILSIIFAYV